MNPLISKDELYKGYAAVVATSLLWSFGGLFIKLIPWSALSINAARCMIALILKTAVRKSVRIKWSRSVIIAGLCLAATTILFSYANKLTTAANAILLQYSAPFFVMLFALIFQKKRPSGFDMLTSVAIVGGIALCFFDNLEAGGMAGNICGVLAGMTFAMMLFVNAMPESDPDSANYLGLLVCSVVGLPSLVQEREFGGLTLLWIVLLGAFQLGLSYIFLEYGIKRVSALSVTFLTAIEPIMNPIWVAIFYGERVGPLAFAGGALVLAASLVYAAVNARRATRISVKS
ncbi:MAG: DMT family transporter [Oscillospiraceae bacterium]